MAKAEGKQSEMQVRLFAAAFIEGKEIGDHIVLERLFLLCWLLLRTTRSGAKDVRIAAKGRDIRVIADAVGRRAPDASHNRIALSIFVPHAVADASLRLSRAKRRSQSETISSKDLPGHESLIKRLARKSPNCEKSSHLK